MKLKQYISAGVAFVMCGVAAFILADKYKGNAYIILFMGGCIAEKVSSWFEGD